MVAVPELGSTAAKQREAQATTEAAPEIIEATFAFIVYQKAETGQYVITSDLDTPIKAQRKPTHDEVYAATMVTNKDMIGQQYAGMAAQATLQLNNFVAQQAQGQADLEKMLAEGLRTDGRS